MKNFKAYSNYIFILFFILLCASCKQINLQEQNMFIKNNKWSSNDVYKSSFEITDTLSKYNIYVVLRHTDAYEFSNIWLKVGLQQQGDSMQYQKLNLNLANDAKGWDGVGMNDIWEVRKLIAKTTLKKGTYNASIGQIMRQNPLNNVLNIGLRVQKAGN